MEIQQSRESPSKRLRTMSPRHSPATKRETPSFFEEHFATLRDLDVEDSNDEEHSEALSWLSGLSTNEKEKWDIVQRRSTTRSHNNNNNRYSRTSSHTSLPIHSTTQRPVSPERAASFDDCYHNDENYNQNPKRRGSSLKGGNMSTTLLTEYNTLLMEELESLNTITVNDLRDFGNLLEAELSLNDTPVEQDQPLTNILTSRTNSARQSLDLTKLLSSPIKALYSGPTTAITSVHHTNLSATYNNTNYEATKPAYTPSSPPIQPIETIILEPEDPFFYFDPADIESHKVENIEDTERDIQLGQEFLENVFEVKRGSPKKDITASPIDIRGNLAPSQLSGPFLQRRFTAPEKSYMSVQERRLKSLRNRHMNAVPLSRGGPSNMSIAETDFKENESPRITYPLKERQTDAGLADVEESASEDSSLNSASAIQSSLANAARANLASLQASLRQRRSPLVENSSYIEHLEAQVAELTSKVKSYTNPASEKSHAAIVQRLNNKVRSLENQVTEWENVFDDRVRENERIHADTERMYVNKLKALREQIQIMDATNAALEDELDKERKENVTLRIEVTEKKALALDNAKLAEAIKSTLATIETIEKDNPKISISSFIQSTIASVLGDDFRDMSEGDTTLVDDNSLVSPNPYLSDIQSANESSDIEVTRRRRSIKPMRRFPGMSMPTPLILSTPVSASPAPSSRRSSSGTFSSDVHRNSNRWSISKETPITESESLFAELAKAQNDDLSDFDEDDDDNEQDSQNEDRFSTASHHSFVKPIDIPNPTSPLHYEKTVFEKSILDELTDHPSSFTDTETASESSSTGTSFSDFSASSSPTSPGLSNLLFAPIRLTSSVITNVGYGIFHPQQLVRNARKRVSDTFTEPKYVDIPTDARTYISQLEASVNDIALDQEPIQSHKVVTPQSRRGTIRQSMLKEFILKPSSEISLSAASSSDESTRNQHIASTFTKLCSEPVSLDLDETPKARRTRAFSSSPESNTESDINIDTIKQSKNNRRQSLRVDTSMLKRHILPIKPSTLLANKDVFDTTSSHRTSLPPPYSEHPDRSYLRMRQRNVQYHRQNEPRLYNNKNDKRHSSSRQSNNHHYSRRNVSNGSSSTKKRSTINRDSLDLAWSSNSEPETETSLYIPESELARVLRKDISNGSLMHAMGLTLGSPVVLWTKLILSFVITMFVAVRDGPDVALEHIDWSNGKDDKED